MRPAGGRRWVAYLVEVAVPRVFSSRRLGCVKRDATVPGEAHSGPYLFLGSSVLRRASRSHISSLMASSLDLRPRHSSVSRKYLSWDQGLYFQERGDRPACQDCKGIISMYLLDHSICNNPPDLPRSFRLPHVDIYHNCHN